MLALDSDLMPGLAVSLGVPQYRDAMLLDAVERNDSGRWRLRRGIGPVRAVERYSVAAPDSVRLLQAGKVGARGLPEILGSINGFYQVLHRISRVRTFEDWAIVGDLPAGPRQPAFDWAPYAETLLVVVEPTWQSALTARRIARIVRARGRTVLPVANKVENTADTAYVEQLLGERVVAAVPEDEAVAAAEQLGVAAIDHAPGSPAVAAIAALAAKLERQYAHER